MALRQLQHGDSRTFPPLAILCRNTRVETKRDIPAARAGSADDGVPDQVPHRLTWCSSEISSRFASFRDAAELTGAMLLIPLLEQTDLRVIVGFSSSAIVLWETASATSFVTDTFLKPPSLHQSALRGARGRRRAASLLVSKSRIRVSVRLTCCASATKDASPTRAGATLFRGRSSKSPTASRGSVSAGATRCGLHRRIAMCSSKSPATTARAFDAGTPPISDKRSLGHR